MSRTFKQRIVTGLISLIVKSASAGQMEFGTMEELLAAASGTTTRTTNNLLPANSLILAVTGRVQTALSGGSVSGWSLGDPTSANRFTANNTTLTTSGNGVGILQWGGGVTTDALGPHQASAAQVMVTFAGGGPTAGAIRITSYFLKFTPPAS